MPVTDQALIDPTELAGHVAQPLRAQNRFGFHGVGGRDSLAACAGCPPPDPTTRARWRRCPLVTHNPSKPGQVPPAERVADDRSLVTHFGAPAAQLPLFQRLVEWRVLSRSLVTHCPAQGSFCASNRDEPCATAGHARSCRPRGSSFRSPDGSATGADFPPWRPGGNPVPDNNADAPGCGAHSGIFRCNAGT